MENVNKIRTGRHCVFRMYVYLIFITKYRCGVFIKAILDNLLVLRQYTEIPVKVRLISPA